MAKRKRVEKKVKVNEAKQLPVGVQIISVLCYIVAIVSVIMGILCIALGAGFADILIQSLGEFGPGIIIIVGIILIGIGVLGIFIGRGLWKEKAWARITAIVLLCLTIILSVYSLIAGGKIAGNIITTAISAAIAIYLIFSEEVKEAFK